MILIVNFLDFLVRYLGLNILKDILKEDKEQLPKFKEFVLENFNSPDPSIKLRALEILQVTA